MLIDGIYYALVTCDKKRPVSLTKNLFDFSKIFNNMNQSQINKISVNYGFLLLNNCLYSGPTLVKIKWRKICYI